MTAGVLVVRRWHRSTELLMTGKPEAVIPVVEAIELLLVQLSMVQGGELRSGWATL